MRLWDPATGTPVGDPLTGHTARVGAVAAVPLPDGRTLLATGSSDGTVRLWDPASPVGDPLTGPTNWVRRRRCRCPTGGPYSPPAATIARCGCGTRKPVPRRRPADRPHRLGGGGGGGAAARRADPARHRQPRSHGAAVGPGNRHPVGDPLTGHTDSVLAAAAAGAVRRADLLATASRDGTVRLWDPATGTLFETR